MDSRFGAGGGGWVSPAGLTCGLNVENEGLKKIKDES